MFIVCLRRRVPACGSRVWAAVRDFGEHQRFKPFIEHAGITNELPLGEGAEREVRLYDGSWMYQRIVDYRPGESMVLEVVQADQWIRRHVAHISVESETEHACSLVCTIRYRAPFGALGVPIGLLYKAILRSQYSHIVRGIERCAMADDSHDAQMM